MIVGYLRVSTEKQHLGNQQEEIKRFAESRNLTIDKWVTEIVSGRKHERDRKLGSLLRRMKRGDTLIVTEVSRLSRTLTDIMAIMGKCLKKEINLFTTKEGYSFDNSINSKVLCFAFDPKRQEHQKIGERQISCIWAELRVVKSGFGNNADTILCAFVDGNIEYEKEHRRKSDAINKKRSDD